jgi:hypothetical protein|tara:strand:+ start:41 stop:559 length:519 start_codon:yes stop_codon:yes gene_type:complete
MLKKLSTAVVLSSSLLSSVVAAEVMDTVKFTAIAKQVIQESFKLEGADVDGMLANSKVLVAMGVAASRAYATNHTEHAELLTLTADAAGDMVKMDLDEIEEAWHEFGYLNGHGINAEEIEHFGVAISLMDTIVHPATVIIALNEYKQDPDSDYMDQVRDELSEVLEHLKHVD